MRLHNHLGLRYGRWPLVCDWIPLIRRGARRHLDWRRPASITDWCCGLRACLRLVCCRQTLQLGLRTCLRLAVIPGCCYGPCTCLSLACCRGTLQLGLCTVAASPG